MTSLPVEWPAPKRVKTLFTLRTGGASQAPWDSFNTATHVGDNPEAVAANRQTLRTHLPADPLWLDQVHGTDIFQLETGGTPASPPPADGSITRMPGRPLAIQTADCLPVLACDQAGSVIGAFHAGWKGLAAGVLTRGLKAMRTHPANLLVWIGPAISQQAYQVGSEVRDQFLLQRPEVEACFLPDGPGRYRFDLAQAAVLELRSLGVKSISLSGLCTWSEPERFFSHRRQAPCGRHASLIWLEG